MLDWCIVFLLNTTKKFTLKKLQINQGNTALWQSAFMSFFSMKTLLYFVWICMSHDGTDLDHIVFYNRVMLESKYTTSKTVVNKWLYVLSCLFIITLAFGPKGKFLHIITHKHCKITSWTWNYHCFSFNSFVLHFSLF